VARVTSTPPSTEKYRSSAQFVGALNTVTALVLAIASARGLTDIAQRHLTKGIETLMLVLVLRWLVNLACDEWAFAAGARIRDYWRANLTNHFARPRREGDAARGDLALAIERASDGPSLQVLETSAQVSGLGLGLIFWAAGWISTVITLALVLCAVPLYRRAGKRSEALTGEYNRRRSLLESRQLELLRHGPELRALGAVSYGADEITAISESEHRVALRAIRVVLESSLITEFLSGVSIGLVAMVVGFGLLGGRISLFHALVAVLVTSELFLRVRRFGAEFHRSEDAAKSLALLREPDELTVAHSDELMVATGLVCEIGDFSLDLNVRPGSRILVTGPSGSGKTTLLHTLIGWRAPRQGTVARSGGAVGFVSAESELLSGSLWENVTLGADVDEVAVLQQLSALGLVGTRFDDLNARLLADGQGLSNGERVRLVLARCLITAPNLLILDDIAGVLDQSSRELVVAALDEHPGLAIVEATVDTPLLHHTTERIEIGP
jgi:ABC-type transport system involved in cytochrome bd biosynthesis fused ATPase/permease subunit